MWGDVLKSEILPQLFSILVVIVTINGQSIIDQQEYYRMKRSPDSDWDVYSPYAFGGSNVEARSPLVMELYQNNMNISEINGICKRIYRVLHQLSYTAIEECRRYYNSRQAGLGDMEEFYKLLVKSGKFNDSLYFPLIDRFPRFQFGASFIHLPSKPNEPALMFELNSDVKQLLCIQSIPCPKSTTTAPKTMQPTPQPKLMNSPTPVSPEEKKDDNSVQVVPVASVAEKDSKTDQFWHALLAGTEPKSWFLATVSLACVCVLLIIFLAATWLYVCYLRRLHRRRRCRGPCKSGCVCSKDLIHRTITDAAVCGPLDSPNQSVFPNPLTPQANGSIRSGFVGGLYSGGTMNSSRWGFGGAKLSTPTYISLSNHATDRTTLLSTSYAPVQNCVAQPHVTLTCLSSDNCSGTWNQNQILQRPSVQLNRRRLSQDAICRSTSEGSSVSGQAGNGPKSFNHGTSQVCTGVSASLVSSGLSPPSMLITNVNTMTTNELNGSASYQNNGLTGYPYADATNKMNNKSNYSPTHLGGRKLFERNCYISSLNGALANGQTMSVAEEGEDNNESPFYLRSVNEDGTHQCQTNLASPDGSLMSKINVINGPGQLCNSLNHHNLNPMDPTTYANRTSDAEHLELSPPSGFYDMNGSATENIGHFNGGLASSIRCGNLQSTNQNGSTNFETHHPYSILGRPGGHLEWSSPLKTELHSNEMVGGLENDSNYRSGSSDSPQSSEQTLKSNAGYKPSDTRMISNAPPKQMLSPRIYTASERML